jgi:hypothetical protein
MTPIRRVILCGIILTMGLGVQAQLESASQIERPDLLQPLKSLPMEMGDWTGQEEPVKDDILAKAQTTEWINRIYESKKDPRQRLWLWINYSKQGTNLRHSPEICLPSGGWTKAEALCREMDIPTNDGKTLRVTKLGYTQGELVQGVGFWYYIFGEGSLERAVRQLPITSRSSHGRTTRGSSMTVEVFCPGEIDPKGELLADFAKSLLAALEPILPKDRAEYYIP